MSTPAVVPDDTASPAPGPGLPSIRVDFVSDVSCPWCAIGLAALMQAIGRCQDAAHVHVHFQPFELNPDMGPEGEDITEHLGRKYGSTAAQQAEIRERIRARGAELGFEFRPEGRGRIWNTFHAHRMLHWAGDVDARADPPHSTGHQMALKRALLEAVHTHGQNAAAADVLLPACERAGLDAEQARAVLASDEWTGEVRDAQRYYLENGIQAVPAVVFNELHLLSGGQPVEVYEQIIRELARSAADPQDQT